MFSCGEGVQLGGGEFLGGVAGGEGWSGEPGLFGLEERRSKRWKCRGRALNERADKLRNRMLTTGYSAVDGIVTKTAGFP